jgi:16S rRNA (cytosine1402-N4)-methyltransferase
MVPARDDLSHVHRPVMVAEVLEHLVAETEDPGRRLVVDGTVGAGGHALALLEADPDLEVLGLDRDPEILGIARRRLEVFAARVRLVHASYADLERVVEDAPIGVLLDLGVSSLQLDDPDRGFSFKEPAKDLDMRFDRTSETPTALELVNALSEKELADVIHEHGEEPRARAVARAIVKARPIRDGADFLDVVRSHAWRTRRHDPATRTLQALRIRVNDEMGHVERGLEAAIRVTRPGGRVVAISFHSGEDRRVKNAFREAARAGRGTVRTKKPIRPTEQETRENRRARPARLRAFEVSEGGVASES